MNSNEREIIVTDTTGKAYRVKLSDLKLEEDLVISSKSKRDKKFFGRLAKTVKEIPNLIQKAYMNWYEKKLEEENIKLSNGDLLDIDVSLDKLEKKLSKAVQSHIRKINANLTDINVQIASLSEAKALAESQERNLMELEASRNPQYKYFYEKVENLRDKVQVYEVVINGLEELHAKRHGYMEAANKDPKVAEDLQKILAELALQEEDYLKMEGFNYESLEQVKADYFKAQEELSNLQSEFNNMHNKLIPPEIEKYESKNDVRISKEYREELTQNIKDLEVVASQLEQEILEAEKTTSDNLGNIKNDEIVLIYNAIQTRKGLRKIADENLDALVSSISNETLENNSEVVPSEIVDEKFEKEQEEYLTEQVGEFMNQANEEVKQEETIVEEALESLDNGELDIVADEQELIPVEHYSMASENLEVVGTPISSVVQSVPEVVEDYVEPIKEVVQEPVQEMPVVAQTANFQNVSFDEKITLVDYNETQQAKESFEKSKEIMSDYTSKVMNIQIENEKKITDHYRGQFDIINKKHEQLVSENQALVEKLNSQEEISKSLEDKVRQQAESMEKDYVPVTTVDNMKNSFNEALTQKEAALNEETAKREQVEANLAVSEQKNSQLSMTVAQKDQEIASLNNKIENEYVPKDKYERLMNELETIKMQISALSSFIQVPSNVNEQVISPNTDEVSTGGKHM